MTNLIKFKKLILDSFLSYDHEEIELDSSGIVYIKGENINESKTDSNGSGKSALISESLLWCLTGKTSRGASEVKNLFLDRNAYVTVFLTKNDIDYEITRGTVGSLKPNGLTIIKNNENVTKPRIADTKEFFDKEFPELSWTVLTSTVNLTQGLVGGFSMLINRDRKAKLEELSKVDNFYELVRTLVDSRHKNLVSKHAELEAKKKDLKYQIDAKNKICESLNATIEELKQKQASLVNLEQAELQYRHNINADTVAVDELELKIEAFNTKKSQIKDAVMLLLKEKSTINETLTKLTSEESQILKDLRNLQDFVNKEIVQEQHLKLHTDSKNCPTCFQKVSDENGLRIKQQLEAEILEFKQAKQDATSKINTHQARLEVLLKEKEVAHTQLTKVSITMNQVEAKERELNSELATLTVQRAEFRKNIMNAQQNLDNLNKIKGSNSADTIITLQANIEAEKQSTASIEANHTTLSAEADTYEYKLKMSSWVLNNTARGLRSFLLEGVVDFINMRCAEYSSYLFDTDLINLKLDGTNLEIYLGQKPIENTSGGEHRRADIVIQLAIRDLVAEQSGFTSNLLIIDEVFDGLDSIGIAAVLDLITSQKDSISSIYLITHKNDANIDYDDIITVRKEDNISKVIH